MSLWSYKMTVKCPLCKQTTWVKGECRNVFCPVVSFNEEIIVRSWEKQIA